MKRPTLRDIAEIAEVSHVTVSLALREHPRIPPVTRQRIQEIARRIGYRPDPALSALMVYRRQARPSGHQGIIAWINTFRQPDSMYPGSTQLYYEGARDRCADLGYKLEEFRLADLGMNFARLSKIFYFRNIQGLIVGQQERNHAHISPLNFEWDRFSAVTLGFTLVRPKLHIVTNAQFRSSRLAMQKLRALGYRRIGCIGETTLPPRTDSNFLGGFLVEQIRLAPADRIPILILPKWEDFLTEPGRSKFRKWFRRHQPDAILDMVFTDCHAMEMLEPAERESCACASICLPEQPNGFAGIHQNDRLIGSSAINELVALIHANERGIPKTPRLILIEGRWVDGASAPRKTYRRSAQAQEV